MTEPQHTLIVPMMKARVPVDLQLEFPLPPQDAPIREPFACGLAVSYVMDLPDRYTYVAPRHLAEMGLRPEALRLQAVVNLRTRRPELSLTWYQDAKAVVVTMGGELEAGLLLDDGIMDKLAQEFEGDLVVAVPARDIFIASGTGHADGLAKLRWAVDRVWPKGDHLLVPDLLIRRHGSWEVLGAAA